MSVIGGRADEIELTQTCPCPKTPPFDICFGHDRECAQGDVKESRLSGKNFCKGYQLFSSYLISGLSISMQAYTG